jgi:hypothetical protein
MSTAIKVSSSSFCKVCFDAGDTEQVYTSHYVRDSVGGKVVCPRLLETVCRYCFENGHTLKYCEKLKHTTRMRERYERQHARQESEKKKEKEQKKEQKKVVKNIYNILSVDSDEEEAEEEAE